jgi:hypothetical protein
VAVAQSVYFARGLRATEFVCWCGEIDTVIFEGTVKALKHFPTFYGSKGSSPHSQEPTNFPFLSQTNPVHTTYISPSSNLMSFTFPCLGLPNGLLPSGFQKITYMGSSSLHSCHMSRPSHPPRIVHSNYTWRRVQIMKLLAMQLSPPSRHSIPLWSKYSPLSTLFSNSHSLL